MLRSWFPDFSMTTGTPLMRPWKSTRLGVPEAKRSTTSTPSTWCNPSSPARRHSWNDSSQSARGLPVAGSMLHGSGTLRRYGTADAVPHVFDVFGRSTRRGRVEGRSDPLHCVATVVGDDLARRVVDGAAPVLAADTELVVESLVPLVPRRGVQMAPAVVLALTGEPDLRAVGERLLGGVAASGDGLGFECSVRPVEERLGDAVQVVLHADLERDVELPVARVAEPHGAVFELVGISIEVVEHHPSLGCRFEA